ncbi:hypothetical protein [Brevirhabdus sp.]|uniref:hypothetical protein n=1 Tax=Brevirhabdus sp. TaxID=2004514 RepID=UPI004059DAE2
MDSGVMNRSVHSITALVLPAALPVLLAGVALSLGQAHFHLLMAGFLITLTLVGAGVIFHLRAGRL